MANNPPSTLTLAEVPLDLAFQAQAAAYLIVATTTVSNGPARRVYCTSDVWPLSLKAYALDWGAAITDELRMFSKANRSIVLAPYFLSR
jgi:hypothetical protein